MVKYGLVLMFVVYLKFVEWGVSCVWECVCVVCLCSVFDGGCAFVKFVMHLV